MRITIDSITDLGLELTAGLDDSWAREAAALALDAEPTALDLEFQVTMVADCVRVTGELSSTFPAACARCQTALTVTLSGRVDLFYSPERGVVPDEQIALERGDLDIGWFDGKALELAQVLSEQLALWLPDRLLCSDRRAERAEGAGRCVVPAQDPGPDLDRHSPFARLRLPE